MEQLVPQQTAKQRGVKVELGSDPNAAQLAEWYAKHGVTPDADGYFDSLPEGKSPVDDAGIYEQVSINAKRHEIRNLKGKPYQGTTMVFIAGGPSLSEYVEEIRAKCADPKYDVFTSNNTCAWMLSKGMKPKYHLILDPTERKKHDIEYEGGDDITLVLGLQCHPALFDAAIARGRKIVKFLAASATRANGKTDTEAALEACTPDDPDLIGIGGGSMAGTRMIYLAAALGYRRIEYYGFDACVSYEGGRVRGYAYNKVRNEHVLEVEAANGRKFHSTASFARQAEEMVLLMDKLPGLEVVVHGDSFMSNQVAMYKAKNAPASYRITQAYEKMMATMHETHDRYGTSGANHASRVFMAGAQIVRKFGSCDILDYGCGKETLKYAMEEAFPILPKMRVLGYDPGIKGKDQAKPADIVVCTDVMEHVERECIDAVLSHIANLTRHVAIINVSLIPAVKTLPDGRNAHISLYPKDWWLSYLKKYFVLIEQADDDKELIVVGQPIGTWAKRMAEKEERKAA